MTKYTLLNDCIIRIGKTNFHPWPNFRITGQRIQIEEHLLELLTDNEAQPMLWRAKIPDELHQHLLAFPNSEIERLLHFSQLNYSQVVDWCEFCPALLTLAPSWKEDDDLSGMEVVENMRSGWKHVLNVAGWPQDRSTLKILQKVPPRLCRPKVLDTLRAALGSSKKQRCLRHLNQINQAVFDLLTLPDALLNPSLLKEVSRIPRSPESLSEICREIQALRIDQGLYPNWPFVSGRLSPAQLSRHLIELEHQASGKNNDDDIILPDPPLDPIRARNFQIEPLTTIKEVFWEGHKMNNCLATYIPQIASGTHYAYRLLRPERASVLMIQRGEEWYPFQIKTANNSSPKKDTTYAVHVFTGTIPLKLENTQNDYPF